MLQWILVQSDICVPLCVILDTTFIKEMSLLGRGEGGVLIE